MLGASAKREAIMMIVAEDFGNTAQACRERNLGPSKYYLTCQKSEVSYLLEQEIISKSKDRPRYGYRRIAAVVHRDGYLVNAKRTQRVLRTEGLGAMKSSEKCFDWEIQTLNSAVRHGQGSMELGLRHKYDTQSLSFPNVDTDR